MNPSDLLTQLRDIHLPDAVSWWPPAPGWWLLTTLLAGVMLWGLLMIRRRRRRFGYRREALNALLAIDPATPDAAQQIGHLLRRAAKTVFPAQHWEALPTPLMLRKLNAGALANPFSNELIGQLELSLYRCEGPPPATVSAFAEAAQQWLDQHRPKHLETKEEGLPC